jgi:hypothetical protein
VTNPSNGCGFLGGITVTQNVTPPSNLLMTSNPVNAVLTCTTTSIAVNANASGSKVGYAWTGPSGFTFNGQTTNISVPGTYSVTATDSTNGCTSTASTTVTQNTTPPAVVTIASAQGTSIVSCTNPTLSITASANPQNVNFAWTGPNSFSANGATTSVNAQGTYTATATETDNGCTKTATIFIAVDTAHPAAVTTSSVPANATLTCTSTNVVLSGSSNTTGVNYVWTGPNGFSVANSTATATTTGSYTLTVINPNNGCSSASPATVVTSNTVVPVGVSANAGNKITCNAPTTTLTGKSTTTGATFSWTGPGGFTSTSSAPTVSLGGVYTLTAINPANGCTASKTVTVVADTAAPAGVTAINSGPLTCDMTTVTLTGNSTTAGVTYIWSGPNGFFDPEQISSSATDSGTYVLSVQGINGCISTASTYVAQDLSACSAIRRTATAGNSSNAFINPASSAVTAFTYKVYPNPVSTTTATIEFTAPTSTMVSVELYNTSGVREQVLFSNAVEANQSYRVTLNRSGLAAGVHYCMIRVNGKVYTSKILFLP